ncbi:branched-chain-amino-acid aminotransferase 2, chloroplastic-like isoform X2 [Daucus carota subsp. sativus]|uniref:branched-chain-amino-acid aminotransferase 2, chloroplastic-like isoform X2 n=1 Tax=Daucus carota subsp. sativus TaxID=79200 RepID=UPI0007F036F1|nr:PREDICTED: branched-chain-amino-acid aminotransferase 2, chloroplastic-like isoform X2 [Daucus carota subsp. sativus]
MIQRARASLRHVLHKSSPLHSSISKVRARHLSSVNVAASLKADDPSTLTCELDNFDWDNLGFNLMPAEFMYTMKCSKGENFTQGELCRYGNIELSPSACVLNYGQGLLEGAKAFRGENGRLRLFRPEQNAIRMQIGAERMCMPSPSTHQFVEAVKEIALANHRWIPPTGKGSLYIRPLLMGSGAILGVAPSPEYTFLIYASPVGNYFKEGTAALNMYVEEEFHRASRGGAGGIKAITNYSPVLKAQANAKNRGFSDVLYLDSNSKTNIEEASSSNVFIVKGNVISTPALSGTILEGITRKSIIEIAKDLGYKVEERCVKVEELNDADEVFCTGTAAGVAPIGSVTYQDKRVNYSMEGQLISQKLYSTLVGIQRGLIEDKWGWIVEID